ncbi:ankyrin repeat-containing protein [Fusarium mexicanum]|uniref:Ankyrin repeat-containing protein n=1 Tax=Fusarium mexicanum TaxID=751941 RepID=A0A8H5I4N1_9HYPO|nr:ankyrin repeat-containing protein [Fusarium mexicanum]
MAGSLDKTSSQWEKDWKSLMCAAEAGDFDTLAALLADGCDIDIDERDYDGCTRLAIAAEKGHSTVVERLLAHDANPNLSDLSQVTPLWKAARYGHASVVKLLLASEKLSDVNPRPAYLHEHKLETPLSIAIKEGHQDTAELLSRADGINPCLTTDLTKGSWEKISILGLAIRGGFEDVALSLLDKCDIGHDSRDTDDNGTRDTIEPAPKLLVFAVAAGCPRIVQELLTKHSPDVNAVYGYYAGEELDWFEDTPLMAASRRGDMYAVRLLLDMDKVKPGVSSKLSGTAISAAAQGGFVDVVKVLIADGRIEVDCKNKKGRTALSFAAERGFEAVVDELLATGATDPNSRDSRARTPLIWATNPGRRYRPGGWQSHEGVTRRLLADKRIAVNAKDNDDRTALWYAAKNGALGLVIALLEHPQIDPMAGPEHTPPLVAASRGHADVVQALLSSGRVDVNTVLARSSERTALMVVVEYGGVESESATNLLLSVPGIDVDFQDSYGMTALMLAVFGGTVGMVKQILAAGGYPNMQDNNGNTALSHARDVEKIKALLGVPGIKPDLPNNMGRTALSLAAEVGEIDCINALLASEEVNPDSRDIHGRGPLSWIFGENGLEGSSKQEERKAILQRLLRIPDVDPNTEDHDGLTPLLLAIMSHQGHEYVEVLLSRSDLDVNRPRAGGLGSPFDAAKQIGNMATMALLRTRGARSGTESDEPDFEYQPKLTDSLLHALRTNLLKEYPLHLGEQQEYLDGWADSTTDMCSSCLEIDLSSAFWRRHTQYEGQVIADLGRVDESWKKRRCPLCRLFATVYPHTSLEKGNKLSVKSLTDGPPPYVALSYVWGQSKGSQPQSQRQEQQEDLDGKGDSIVEPAIEDAIQVTLKLGYKYLWVDRYCIVQTGDEAIKQEQLRHMHLVYANAEVTLIAAAGADSSAGLPGAPGRSRNQQPGALIQGHAVVCIPPDPSLHIRSSSTWATRGWTYQEGLLARRRLFFSEYEMSYECRHMLCREAIRLPRGLEQTISGHKPRFMEPFWMYQPYKLPGMDSSQTGIGIFDLLAVYTKRKLSLPSDALNAMLGIFSLLSQHKTRPRYHICGVPLLRLTGSHLGVVRGGRLNTTASDTDVAAAVSLGGFLDGLCWQLEEPAHRRQGFPSWSWTGWQGVVAGMNKDSRAIEQPNGLTIEISIMSANQDGEVAVPWSRCYNSLRMVDGSNPDIQSGQNHVLEITASAVTVRFRRGEYDGRLNTWIGTVCAGHGVWQGEFFFTSKDLPLSSLLQEPWTGIILGNSRSQRYTNLHDTTVVVIQEQKREQKRGNGEGHTYGERVGLLRLVHCTIEARLIAVSTQGLVFAAAVKGRAVFSIPTMDQWWCLEEVSDHCSIRLSNY